MGSPFRSFARRNERLLESGSPGYMVSPPHRCALPKKQQRKMGLLPSVEAEVRKQKAKRKARRAKISN